MNAPLEEMDWTEREMAAMYRRVRRQPAEGTATEAIKVHAQACGFVAYAFNVHPDDVATCVAEYNRLAARVGTPT